MQLIVQQDIVQYKVQKPINVLLQNYKFGNWYTTTPTCSEKQSDKYKNHNVNNHNPFHLTFY